jgi:hypothetical protein
VAAAGLPHTELNHPLHVSSLQGRKKPLHITQTTGTCAIHKHLLHRVSLLCISIEMCHRTRCESHGCTYTHASLHVQKPGHIIVMLSAGRSIAVCRWLVLVVNPPPGCQQDTAPLAGGGPGQGLHNLPQQQATSQDNSGLGGLFSAPCPSSFSHQFPMGSVSVALHSHTHSLYTPPTHLHGSVGPLLVAHMQHVGQQHRVQGSLGWVRGQQGCVSGPIGHKVPEVVPQEQVGKVLEDVP